jgi:hypothetical protein
MKYIMSGSTVVIETIYDDYATFMDETRDPIYQTILKSFNDLKETERIIVNVKANVENTQFESNLEFTKANIDVLVDVLIPFFESEEKYELCAEAMKLHSELISQ